MSTSVTVDIDPEVLRGFIDEANDALADVDALFIELENDPHNLEIVNAIFRPVHSLKGNAPFFGFTKMKSLAHEMESVLQLVREERLGVSKNLIDTLLRGLDELKKMVARIQDGQSEVSNEESFKNLVEEVKAIPDEVSDEGERNWKEVAHGVKKVIAALEEEGLREIQVRLQEVEKILNQLNPYVEQPAEGGEGADDAPVEIQTINSVLQNPIIETLDGDLCKQVRAALEGLKAIVENESLQQPIAEALENYDLMAEAFGFDNLLRELILDKVQKVEQSRFWEAAEESATETSTEDPAAAAQVEQAASGERIEGQKSSDTASAKGKGSSKNKDKDSHKSMRISEQRIDTFLAFVGELIIVGEMLNHLLGHFSQANIERRLLIEFKQAYEVFVRLSNNLQRAIMSIRKISVKALLQKVPRLVRDIANQHGKEIRVEVEGEDVEIDKSLTDLLDAPLTHMVRNAADHGIELPDERERVGKDRTGTIRVAVEETEEFIVLKISDDGGGLNYEKIQEKAESLGLVEPGVPLTHEQVVDFIFQAGVSTAEKVSDISGRGVGMDVVKRMIEGQGGSIQVESTSGQGSVFTINVVKSVTTQILQGFAVRVAEECYIFPLKSIRETFQVSCDEINTIVEKGRCVTRHETVLPVISFRDVLGLPRQGDDMTQELLVSTMIGKRLVALMVDDVLGVSQFVLKPMDGLEKNSELFAGGAVMGDGHVALVVNLDKINEEVDVDSVLQEAYH